MPTGTEWIKSYERAKFLEKLVVDQKQEAWAKVMTSFPELSQKHFGSLVAACRRGKLPIEVANLVDKFESDISSIINEAKFCRNESERLLEENRKADTRRTLDPAIDTIPLAIYPKIQQCKIYPLRHNCNYGENSVSRWDRCSYMKYDDGKSIHSNDRWICTEPK